MVEHWSVGALECRIVRVLDHYNAEPLEQCGMLEWCRIKAVERRSTESWKGRRDY